MKSVSYWCDKIALNAKCRYAANELKAKQDHYIIILKEFDSVSRRDSKGNLLRPTISTQLRKQGFYPKIIWIDESRDIFRVLHIRTTEKLNYFKLLFPQEIEHCVKVSEL